MSTTINLKDAEANLNAVIHRLGPGEKVVIVENNHSVATLVVAAREVRRVPKPGTQPGSVLDLAPNLGAPLEEFKQ